MVCYSQTEACTKEGPSLLSGKRDVDLWVEKFVIKMNSKAPVQAVSFETPNEYFLGMKLIILGKFSLFKSEIFLVAGSLESAYSLIWGSHKIWGKGGGDTLDLLW